MCPEVLAFRGTNYVTGHTVNRPGRLQSQCHGSMVLNMAVCSMNCGLVKTCSNHAAAGVPGLETRYGENQQKASGTDFKKVGGGQGVTQIKEEFVELG